MTRLGRAAPIHRFGISAFRYPGPSAFWHPALRHPALRHPGTPATHSRCRGAVFVLRHNVRDSGTMPVMNDEVPGVAGIARETTSMAHDGTRFTSSHGSSDGHSVTTPTRNTNRWLPALKAAFPLTIPICLGFLFLGASYGILSGTIVYMLLVQLVF